MKRVRRSAPKVLNAKNSALRPRMIPHREGYLDDARLGEGIRPKLRLLAPAESLKTIDL